MNVIEEYERLKREEESKRRTADRAQGALQLALAQLEAEHGCLTALEGAKLLGRKRKDKLELERKLAALLLEINKNYQDKL